MGQNLDRVLDAAAFTWLRVLSVASRGSQREIDNMQWLHRQGHIASKGSYVVSGKKVNFNASSPKGTIQLEGLIQQEQMTVRSVTGEDEKVYEFHAFEVMPT